MIAWSTVILRLGLALAFGALIGVEREWRQKHAGLKTMALVALGAATFAMLSNTFGLTNHNPGQLAAAVAGGIGFIGAGVIMHRGTTVQGVTTAATLWSVASVGVAVGLGQFSVGGILTVGILIVQFVMRSFETAIFRARHGTSPGRFELRVECEGEALPSVNATLARHSELTALRRSVMRGAEQLAFRAVMRAPAGLDLSRVEEEMIALEGVRRVEIRHLGIEADE